MDYHRMGRRIQEKRIAAGMTQEQLAEAVELSAVFVSQIETGNRKPSLDTIVKIAIALHVSVDTLLKDSLPVNLEYAVRSFSAMIQGRTEEEVSTVLDTVETMLKHFKGNSILK